MLSSEWVYLGLGGTSEFRDRKDSIFWPCYFRVVVSIILKTKFELSFRSLISSNFRKIHSQLRFYIDLF